MRTKANAAFSGLTPTGREARVVGWKMRCTAEWIVKVGLLLIVAALLGQRSAAQLEIGNDLSMGLNGNIGFNYNGNINQGDSSHDLGLSGDATLHGSFYSPNFLNFNIQPFYNRAQTNDLFGSVTNASGVNANLNLFGGSHFPGTITYNRVNNDTSQFGVPGGGIGLAQHGNDQGFGVSWSALVTGWPTLTASYSIADGSASIFGSPDQSTQTNRDFIVSSTYNVHGFRLAGGFTHRTLEGNFIDFAEGTAEQVQSNDSTNTYQFNAQHGFPMQGAWNVGWSRTAYTFGFHDGSSSDNSGASDNINGNLTFRPATKLTVSVLGSYNDSLLGSVPEQVQNGGGLSSLGTFRGVLLGAQANYQLFNNLNVQGNVNHQQQEFLGHSYSATFYGGSANYNLNRNFLGSFSFSLAAFDTANQLGNSNLGFTSNVNFQRKMWGWDISGNYSYSQNVQTLILVYTTSSMGYVTNARRRLGTRTFFMAGYSGTHSGITQNSETMNSADRVSSSITYGKYSANAYYSTAKGTAFFTPNGLVAVPTGLPPSAISQDSLLTYNSKAYGFNVSATPIRRLNLSAGYSSSRGDTIDPSLSLFTRNDLITGLGQYRLRKVFLNAGYTRLRQSVGAPGTSPVVVTSYFIGFSRWFNFF
ncbi:MAG TPA: hypothetical protein VMI10_26400 [Terriglobales bacterium]|nr:hypothetical protein [Terriglobales bacterium]